MGAASRLAGESLRGFEVNNWAGLLAPAGTPPQIAKRWNAEVTRVMQSPDNRRLSAAFSFSAPPLPGSGTFTPIVLHF